jgi:hypothetical protein
MGPAYTAPARMIAELNMSVQQLPCAPDGTCARPQIRSARDRTGSGKPPARGSTGH